MVWIVLSSASTHQRLTALRMMQPSGNAYTSRVWGFAGISLVNLYAWRCRYPQVRNKRDPVGPDNDLWLTSVIGGAPHAIAMWGNHGARIYSEGIRRDTLVITLRSKWSCFGKRNWEHPS